MSEVTDGINTAEVAPPEDIVAPVVNQSPTPEPAPCLPGEEMKQAAQAAVQGCIDPVVESAAKELMPAQAEAIFFLPPHVGNKVRFPSGEIVTAGSSVSREEFEALKQLVSAAPLVQQVAEAVGIPVSREEFEAIREELNILNNRIADFNQRSGQRI